MSGIANAISHNLICSTGIIFIFLASIVSAAGPIIIDHNCTNIWSIPGSAVNQAKADLHIAYGHTHKERANQ